MPDRPPDTASASTDFPRQFPLLYAPDRWEWAKADVTFSMDLPPDDLVQSVHVVGFIGDQVVLCRDERPEVWFLPGGTREPDESIDACIRREFAEEAGGQLIGEPTRSPLTSAPLNGLGRTASTFPTRRRRGSGGVLRSSCRGHPATLTGARTSPRSVRFHWTRRWRGPAPTTGGAAS